MRKDIKFENSGEIRDFKEYSENKLAVAKVCVLSTAPNSHQLNISEEVLRRDIGSIRGNFLVAHMFAGDATTHTSSEVPVGYFLPDEPIEFEEVDQDGEKIVKAWAYAVLSKQYAKSAYDMFVADNHRATSIEMAVVVSDDDEHEVVSFDAYGSTILGKTVLPSCKDAEISLVRFAEEANNFYGEHKSKLSALKQFAKEREQMAKKNSYVNHPVDTSKEALYEGEWDGQKAKQDLVKEKNFKTLAPKVCMKLESGWENREVTKLGYPIMMLHDGKWVYNKGGLSSALGYAKKENETTVVNKIDKIYKNLGLDQDGKEADAKMAEIKFAAVNIGDMWNKMWDALHAKYPDGDWGSVYRIDGIYEEDNKKFAIIHHKDEDAKYRLDFSLTEEGLTLAEEIVKVELEIVETDEVKKFAEPENADKYKKFEDKDDKQKDDDEDDDKGVEMSADEMKEKIAKLEADVAERDNIIMEKDACMAEQEKELAELREFKAGVEKKEITMSVEALMSDVKACMSEDSFKSFREEGLKCNMSELDAWKNKVKAVAFEGVKKTGTKDKDGVWTFSAPITDEPKKSDGLWKRLANR